MGVKMGRPKNGTNGAQTERVQIRLRPEDRKMIEELIDAGYAESVSAVIRRSIAETFKWEFAAK